jgi:hypothetical protein
VNYKLLILLFFVFLVYSLQSIEKTSKATDEASEKINLHISILDVNVSILMNGSTCESFNGYCVADVVNVTNKLVNVGNVNATGNLLTIMSKQTNEIHRESWYDVNVSEGEHKYYDTIHKLQDKDVDYSIIGPEIFTVMSNYSFDNKFNDTSCSFKVKKGIGTLQRFPDQIVETIPPGRTNIYSSAIQLWLQDACDSTIATLNTTKGIPGDWVSFPQDSIYLKPYKNPNDFNYTDVNITIPSLIPKGVYDNGSIFIYAGGQTREVRLNITVAMVDFILNITVQEKGVCPGKIIPASINITKILPPGDVNVTMTYQIVDSNHTVYDENRDDNVPISNISVQKLSTLTVPSFTNKGNYMFLVTLDYNSTLTQDYDTFEVSSCPTIPETPGGGGPGIEAPIPSKTEVRAIGLNLSTDTLTVITGNKTSFIASVKNIGSELVKSVKISIEGVPQDWIRIFPTTTDIDISEVEEYLVVINVPNNATSGIYKLKIKATDDIESNTVILTLIIGRDPKEIADLLLKELEGVRAEAKKSLLIGNCMDITVMKTFYQDAESSFEKGMNEYKNRNYEGAVNWFEYAIPIEKKVVNKVDITLELEIETTNTSKFLIPPFYKSNEQFQLAGEYLEEKNYEKICDPLEKIRKFILIGLIFWPGIIILFIILIILIIIFIRRRRGQERVKILEKVRERLRT